MTTSGTPGAQLPDASDGELIEWARNGDNQAFGELWRRHYNAGRTVARSFSSSLDPDDLVQESFAKIYQAVQKGGGPTGAFRAYLFTTIRNTAAAWGRARHETSIDTLESFEDPDTNEESSLEALDRGLTAKAFRSLPTRWQEVLWYTEIEQMTPQQTAPLLGMKANSVAALAYRAREGLRQAWIQAHLQSVPDGSEHQWTIERLGSYARGALGERDKAKLESHLNDCARCTIVAAEAKDVSSRIALVLLPLTAGVAGATAYLAWIQQGGQHAAVTVAMPAAVTGTAVTVTGQGAAGGGAATMAGSPAGAATGTFGGGSPAAGTGTAGGGGTAGGTGSGGAAGGTTAGTAGAAAAGGVATGVVIGTVAAGLVAASVAAAAIFGPIVFAPTGPPEAGSSQIAPADDSDEGSGAGADTTTPGTTVDEPVVPPATTPPTPPEESQPPAPPRRSTPRTSIPPVTTPVGPPVTGPTTPPAGPGTDPVEPVDPDEPEVPPAPDAPVVFAPDTGNGTLFPILSGTAEPGSVVTITEAEPVVSLLVVSVDEPAQLAEVTADESGFWSTTPLDQLSAGIHSLEVRQTTPAGVSEATRVDVTLAAPVIQTPIDDDNVVTHNRPNQYFFVTVHGVPGASVRLLVDAVQLGPETLDADGNVTFRVDGPFPDAGSFYTITAQYTDSPGQRTGLSSAAATVTSI